MCKIFEVELASENGCTELALPATPYALLDALEKLDLSKGERPSWEIIQTSACHHISPYLDINSSLSELNALTQQLARLNEAEQAIVEGLVKAAHDQDCEQPVSMSRIIDMAYSTDCCHLVEGVVTDAQLGRFCAENGFVPDVDELSDGAFELLDFEKIGWQFRENEGGTFVQEGYVQQHDELKQVYQTLDLTLKKPDHIILAERADGSQVTLPAPLGETMADGPAQCVDCTAPSLSGHTAMLSTMDMLARRLSELELDGKLPKYKAVLEATGCDDISRALTLADELDRYSFAPELLEPDEVASSRLKELLPEEVLDVLLPNVNLYRCGQKMMEQSGGKLTGYGYVQPLTGPTQTMDEKPVQGGMEMM